jgi:hypothetical protein
MKRSFFYLFLGCGLIALFEPIASACTSVPGYTACYDSTRIATTAFNPTAQTVSSYDDATSIGAKAGKDDNANETLNKAIAAGLNP